MATEEDVVCRREVECGNPQFFSEYDNRTYVFCSRECKRKFDDHPDHYIQAKAREELPG
ncbi:MAG: YHS domain-containing protein [Acidobacteriaceae bacterium]|nr:YHS domain-containing protein [Acidobacteriaceae bacterium]